MICIFLIIILLFLLFFYYNNYLKKNINKINIEKFDISEYKKIMLDNHKKNIYKISLNKNISLNKEDCFQKCNSTDCIKMDNMQKVLDKCVKCNSQENKCFNRTIIG